MLTIEAVDIVVRANAREVRGNSEGGHLVNLCSVCLTRATYERLGNGNQQRMLTGILIPVQKMR